MKDTVEQYKTAEGKDKEVLLTQLKNYLLLRGS